jgi:heme exporter protein C
LYSGIIWSKRVWSNYFILDARFLSSIFMFLFFFLFFYDYFLLKITTTLDFNENFFKIISYIFVFGFFNIPILKYSVYWWNTMHQKETLNYFLISLDFCFFLCIIFCFLLIFFKFYFMFLFIYKYNLNILLYKIRYDNL